MPQSADPPLSPALPPLTGAVAAGASRVILHVDMDAFYASVEQRDNPELRGKPVLVGGRGKRGVITTASYEARRFGCRSAMPTGQALRLCPQAIVVRGRMDVYSTISKQVRAILLHYTPDVQPISIDEAFMDVSLVRHLHGDGPTIARKVREQIRRELQLTASIGISCNKFLAKVASDMCKPDGMAEIDGEKAAEILAPMPVTVIFGVGPAAGEKLRKLGVKTVGDLVGLGETELARHVGGPSAALWSRLALGLDDRPVHTDYAAKSIGKERTFGEDIADPAKLRSLLLGFVEDVSRDLRGDNLVCRRVTVKLRTGDFSTYSRSATLAEPTDETETIWAAVEPILRAWISERRPPLRLLGVSLHELGAERQLGLFGAGGAGSPKQAKVDAAMDAVVKMFGKGAVRRGGSV